MTNRHLLALNHHGRSQVIAGEDSAVQMTLHEVAAAETPYPGQLSGYNSMHYRSHTTARISRKK